MELDHPDLPYLLALQEDLSLHPAQQVTLLKSLGSARAALNTENTPEALERAQAHLNKIKKLSIGILDFRERAYPQRLLNTASFPPLLFYRGDAGLLNTQHSVGIVGSRKMTEYGARVCADFVPSLTEKGVTIVSGMAFGVDAAAHQACLNDSGKTVAVLAQGVDRSYPSGNSQIFSEICRHGCVVSEFAFPVKKGGETFLFPRRNRIVSALSDTVLVVEAGKNSGALITATYALEQNRTVFAVPGTIYQNMSEGCLDLMRQGAGVATSAQVLLDDLGLKEMNRSPPINRATTDFFETPLEKNIFLLCEKSPHAMDDLLDHIDESAAAVSATVTKMELMGRLKTIEGRKFVAVN
jgi:DNA processing protein